MSNFIIIKIKIVPFRYEVPKTYYCSMALTPAIEKC